MKFPCVFNSCTVRARSPAALPAPSARIEVDGTHTRGQGDAGRPDGAASGQSTLVTDWIRDERARTSMAFRTVESTLTAENWYFEKVREELEKTAPLADFPTISGTNGHDYLMHFTQFLFFLRALDCTDPDQIAAFLDSHNAKIEADLASPNFRKSRNEFQKAIFRPERRDKILDSIRALGKPVFAIYEYGHLLIDVMSPKTTDKLLEDLRFGKLMVRHVDDRIEVDQKRVLIGSTGFLEETYTTSLLLLRRMIADTLTPEERAAASE